MYVHLNELRQRITIQRPVSTVDDMGNLIQDGTEDVCTVWAKVLPYAAKISDGYAEKVDEVSYRIAIRYRADIEVTDTILWQGKKLIISAPPYPLDGLRKYLIMEAKELVEDG
ncbi:phage head closure protein [Selenomonas ruminantium]|jgi:SPP1 family predicted phage head-tail adaptor|uniref:Phage head-tail adaptor, putative, SPP1 family n=1 Tax=Selenomonas ruminantium TaxID=971 RepID=A0A1K1M7R2_SELRU|nr:phage head closure protein [Selenomonas ruminantium]SFW17990.1 phage head-tail adaptor, putative, SPP1 family [Selenomonas ruminantium]